MTQRFLRKVALPAMLAIGAVACGDGGIERPGAAPAGTPDLPQALAAAEEFADRPDGAATTPAPDSDLPSVELVDVATGTTVNLAGFAP
ncbi:MAG: hypothetical protein OXF00_10520, partial [bacterium]|nr:hypothetical protein [bacterium]